jgi:DNA-binding response OmpR family regulator
VTRIAVVNNDTDFLTLMRELLSERGWEAKSYREADTAYHDLKADPPDLIILDIRLERPESGWMVAELLKLDPETRHIPIIVCSAALEELRTRADWLHQHGMGTLPKPFDIDDLYAAVEAALRPEDQTPLPA